jgi:hypothetical protein
MDPAHCPLQEGRRPTAQEEGQEGPGRRGTLSFRSEDASARTFLSSIDQSLMDDLLAGWLGYDKILVLATPVGLLHTMEGEF